jgi:HD-GYP domain-containing protein (c-di-GMP phosphodiesterase class II)
MKAATSTVTPEIAVDALRVGMFVHLDVGWMSHPFPLSSFRITTAAQLATIRSLGLARVRWSPQDSDLSLLDGGPLSGDRSRAGGAAANDDGGRSAGAGAGARVGAGAVAVAEAEADADATTAVACAAATEPGRLDATPPSPEEGSRIARQMRLEAQREALKLCERQYGEASRACRQTFDLLPDRPVEARGHAEALTRALVDKMIDARELCIRVICENAADKASMHAMNVAVISLLMGRSFGFSAEEIQDLGVGAMLHDVGKLELPLRLRHREDNFSPSELRVYQEHVETGLVQAKRMGLTAGAAAVIAQHHEHADGSGFPAALNSDRMTMAARIVALVNRYDNLCNPRLPARALTPHEALSLLFAQGRSKYDTSILGAFIKMMGVYPPGSTVQLTDDRYATVVAVNSSRPLKPSVLVHDPAVPREEALVLDLERAVGLGIRRSIKPQQLPPTALDYLAPSPRVAYFFEPAPALEAA